jgi:plasmid maintenance system antidote protein VapI
MESVEKEENLVKKTCRELGITQKELAEIFHVTPHTVTNWVRGRMEEVHKRALKGLIYEHRFQEIKYKLHDVSLDKL